MEKEKLENALKDLANGNSRSEAAKLREIFEQIENTLDSGVCRSDVLRALHDHGFKMRLRSFESALYRIRKLKQKSNNRASTKTMKIAGFEVSAPNKLNHNPKPENDLLT